MDNITYLERNSKQFCDYLINRSDFMLIKILNNKLDNKISKVDFEIIKLLINLVKDKNIIDTYLEKYTSFYRFNNLRCIPSYGWQDSFYQIIKLLTNNVQDIQLHQNTLIALACDCGHLDLMELLIEKGIDISKDKLLFRLAIDRNHYDIAKIFIEQMPNICFEDNELLYNKIISNDIEAIIFLLENGGNTNIFDDVNIVNIVENNNPEGINDIQKWKLYTYMYPQITPN